MTMTGVTCRQCQRDNPAARRFCGGCGASLWEQCPRCAAACAADERFCGQCGSDIRESRDTHRLECEKRINDALVLAEGHEYDKAIAALRMVARSDDARFERFAERARAEIERIALEQDEQVASAKDALLQARRLLDTQHYDAAQLAIEKVPEPLRTPEHRSLFQRAQSSHRELVAVSAEIRQAVERKETGDLLPKLQRLLALKPDHAQAKQMAGQLVGSLTKSAKNRLAQHKYQEALDSLETIPAWLRSEEVETLLDTATELQSLTAAVRGGALADRTLLALAERLCKLAPKNVEAARLRDQVAAKVAERPADRRLAAVNWSPQPPRTRLGPPIDWLASLGRPALNDEAARTLQQHPGQFFTALGLALEGVELALIDAGLTPVGKAGVLSKLHTISLGRRPITPAWGLDLSASGLKAIKLVRDQEHARVEACLHVPPARPIANSANETERAELIAGVLAEFVRRADDLQGVKVSIGLAGHRVLGRFFELPPMPAKTVGDSVLFEAKHQLPMALEELCWSYAIESREDAKAADDQPRRVMLQACRESHVRERVGLFKAAGIHVDRVQSDCVALHNALVYESASTSPAAGSVAALDCGSEETNVVVCSPAGTWFRTFGIGGDQFARQLVKQLGVTAEQAQRLLQEPARARRFGRWQEALAPLYMQFASEIERSLATHQKLYPDHPIRQIYGLGGAFQTFGVLRHLRTEA